MDNGNGGSERAGPPSGGPVRSIRKDIVLPGFGPTDLHCGKNGYVPWQPGRRTEATRPPGPLKLSSKSFKFRLRRSEPESLRLNSS